MKFDANIFFNCALAVLAVVILDKLFLDEAIQKVKQKFEGDN